MSRAMLHNPALLAHNVNREELRAMWSHWVFVLCTDYNMVCSVGIQTLQFSLGGNSLTHWISLFYLACHPFFWKLSLLFVGSLITYLDTFFQM